jgi:hypothetical protein
MKNVSTTRLLLKEVEDICAYKIQHHTIESMTNISITPPFLNFGTSWR